MPIFFKTDLAAQQKIARPYFKLSDGNWVPLKRVLAKVDPSTWKEVWPSQIFYTHTGYGYGMSMFDCFGRPTDPGDYYFINQGTIGGVNGSTGFSLVTGNFPPGSRLFFINQGRVIGSGGNGMYYTDWGSSTPPIGGGSALRLDQDIVIDNSAGLIAGGGGGGGAECDPYGSWVHHVSGGGGAGVPPGQGEAGTATETAPASGGGGVGGAGGGLGSPGVRQMWLPDNDRSMIGAGAPGGLSIMNSGHILDGSVGIDGAHVVGKMTSGRTGSAVVQFNSFVGTGMYGSWIYVNLNVYGGATTSATFIEQAVAWCGFGDGDYFYRADNYVTNDWGWTLADSPQPIVEKVSETQYRVRCAGDTSCGGKDYGLLAVHRGVLRVTATNGVTTDTIDIELVPTDNTNDSRYG